MTPVTISLYGNFSPRICVVLNQRQGFNDPIGQEQSICPSVALPLLSRGDSHDNSRYDALIPGRSPTILDQLKGWQRRLKQL